MTKQEQKQEMEEAFERVLFEIRTSGDGVDVWFDAELGPLQCASIVTLLRCSAQKLERIFGESLDGGDEDESYQD